LDAGISAFSASPKVLFTGIDSSQRGAPTSDSATKNHA
jgi:hypothetical protein